MRKRGQDGAVPLPDSLRRKKPGQLAGLCVVNPARGYFAMRSFDRLVPI